MIRLAFYKGPTKWYGRLIRFWTNGPYSHVEILIDETAFSSLEGIGTRYLMYPCFKPSEYDYVDIPADDVQQAHIWNWCMAEMNCGYDWKGIFLAQIMGLRRQDPDKWFCSEFCLAALQIGGICKGVHSYKYSPMGLYRLLEKRGLLNVRDWKIL